MWQEAIEKIPDPILAKYFTRDAPLGPLNARLVAHSTVLELLTERELNNLKGQSHRPSIIVGRRGSGKTSYLRRLGLYKDPHLFLEIRTEKTFNLILGTIHNIIRDAISVEAVASIWDGIFWNCLFWLLHRSGRPEIGRPAMHAHLRSIGIENLHNLEGVMMKFSTAFQQIAKETSGFAVDRISDFLRGRSFDALKSSAIRDLERLDQVALIVLDSLDEYPVRVDDFKKSLAGLLKCAGEFNAVVQNFDIRLCLPSELYVEFVERVSTNSLKDFSNQLIVSWQVNELLIAACRRIMICLKLFHPRAYRIVAQNPLESRRDADEFFAVLFPTHVKNLNGVHEKTPQYLLRHTQLLPRQLFLIIGEILKLNTVNEDFVPGKTPFISELAICYGIRDTEDRIVAEIFSAFRDRYPEAKDACMTILPTLSKVFTADQFARAVRLFGEEHGHQLKAGPIRRMLIEIGALGKVDSADSSYTRAKFEYTMALRLPVGADDRLCVHPLFSRVFECQTSGKYDRPILPLAADL